MPITSVDAYLRAQATVSQPGSLSVHDIDAPGDPLGALIPHVDVPIGVDAKDGRIRSIDEPRILFFLREGVTVRRLAWE